MPWSTPAATDSRVHHSARPSACATSASARRSRAWQQPGWSRVAGIVGCAFRSPIQTRIGTGTGIRPPCLPERTSVTGRRSRTRAGSAGKRPATHTGSLLPVSKRRRHPGGEVNAGGFGGQSPTTRARSAHDIKPRRSPQCSAGRYTHGHAHSTVGCLRRSPLARRNLHVAVRRLRLHHAVQVHAVHASIGRHRIEPDAAWHLHVEVDLRSVPAPAPVHGLRRNSAVMAPPRRLILRVHGANRDAIRVLDHLDEQFAVVIAPFPRAFYTRGIPGSTARSNLSISIAHFQGLPSLQAALPMKIALREDRPLFALRPCGHTSHQRNHRHTKCTGYPAPY